MIDARWIAMSLGLFTLAAALGCNGPLPFMSGGVLAGEEVPVPPEWSSFESFGVVQLETRPEEPYSVNIAYTLMGGNLYINAGDTETEWVKHMESDPLVRLRMEGAIYPLRSLRVTDRDEIVEFGIIWTSLSVLHRDPAELDEVWIYRLVAR